jgi:cytochrome P450
MQAGSQSLTRSADIIGSISFSRPYGYIEAGDDNGMFAKLKATFKSIAWLTRALWIFRLHLKLKSLFGSWFAVAAGNRNGYFNQFAWREINARKDRGGDDQDILGKLLMVQQGKPQMDDTNIAFMMTSNVTAGSDTTSFALSSVFHYLLRSPHAYRSLMDELEDKKARGELSPIVAAREAESCAYLQAVIYEAMRLRPSVGLTLDRVVPAGGMTIDGLYIPEGVRLGL